jgi:ABC-type transport system involved in multi-copper enzyme maturation permease subunit
VVEARRVNPSATLLVALHDLRRTLRSARVLALLAIFVGSFLLTGFGFVRATELAGVQAGGSAQDAGGESLPSQFFHAVVRDAAWADALAATPSIVLFFFGAALAFLPALACLMSFDAVASELQNRSARYALLRCDRTSWLVGKLLGQVLLLAALVTFVGVVLFALAALRIPGFDVPAALPYLLRYDALAILYGSVFVALAVLASSLVQPPLLALLLSFCGLLGMGVLWALGASSSLGVLAAASPFAHLGRFFAPDLPGVAAAAGIHLAYLAVLSGAALLVMRARDV